MINVNFGLNNKVVTLKDRIDINPYFLVMELQFKGMCDFIKLVQVTDLSSELCKANKISFELVEEANEDLLNGQVYLIGGDYNYKIYQTSIVGNDITGAKLLENGILRYDTDSFEEKSLEQRDSDDKTLLL